MESMVVEGRERRYLLHRPTTQGKLPLVIALHALGGTPQFMELMTQLSRKADDVGFLVAYPEGTKGEDGMSSWNAGFCCRGAMQQGVNDVAFMDAIIDRSIAEHNADSDRIFVTGMSNGGMLVHLIGAALSNKVAAIAPVAATIGTNLPRPTRPVSVILFHGMRDHLTPYEHSIKPGFQPVRSSAEFWVHHNGCSPVPEVLREEKENVERYTGGREGSEVEVHLISDAGHVWPGGKAHLNGQMYSDLSATDLMIDFFFMRSRASSP
jgi:polyhydroxybutyrate depolymerase